MLDDIEKNFEPGRCNEEKVIIQQNAVRSDDPLDEKSVHALAAALPRVAGPLRCLSELGVGYLQLGQGSHTLSGGEAQRLKLAAELTATARHEPTLYVLDEPTTGLHFDDVRKLLDVVQRLVGLGNTVVVIEHNLDVMKSADWIIDLGPDGGEYGGKIVACGTPEQVARHKKSYTAEALRKVHRGGVKHREQRDGADLLRLDRDRGAEHRGRPDPDQRAGGRGQCGRA
jgi:ABC-type multidrug transport system ATPase subunit